MASCIREPGVGDKPKELIKVCIVDDDKWDLLMMGRTLEKSGEFACVGAYLCADQALDGVPKVVPQVVLMDVRMPGMSGIECARRLKSLLPGLLVIFVTGLFDAATMTAASQAGGDDYLLKPLVIAQCLVTIGFALKRRCATGGKAQSGWTPPLPQLTERETAVMDGLASGLLYKEIAEKLQTTRGVVHNIQHRIFSKWRVANRSEAIAAYHTTKWLTPSDGPRGAEGIVC